MRQKEESIISKIPVPAVTMPFQAKNTGNGGNATTLVMERMMAARQANQDGKPPPFTCSKRVVQAYENSVQALKPRKLKSVGKQKVQEN